MKTGDSGGQNDDRNRQRESWASPRNGPQTTCEEPLIRKLMFGEKQKIAGPTGVSDPKHLSTIAPRYITNLILKEFRLVIASVTNF